LSPQGSDPHFCYTSASPHYVNLEAAPGSEARHAAIRPLRRQRRENPDESLVALQQHLHDGGRASQVPVYLEDARRVQIQEAAGGEVADERTQMMVGEVALSKPGPAADGPRPAPTRVPALCG
jgi:hypothetical protein